MQCRDLFFIMSRTKLCAPSSEFHKLGGSQYVKSPFPRARALGFVTFQLVLIFPLGPPYSGAFFLADQRGIVCFPKKMFVLIGANMIEFLEITMGG